MSEVDDATFLVDTVKKDRVYFYAVNLNLVVLYDSSHSCTRPL